MAAIGHIKLGPYNDIRPYNVLDPRSLSRDGANPFAAPSGGNQGYNDLSGWAEWTMQDWSAGYGIEDPEGGGFYYGNSLTYVPRQIILPMRITSDEAVYLSGYTSQQVGQYTSYLVIDGTVIEKGASLVQVPTVGAAFVFTLYAYCVIPRGVTLTVQLRQTDSGDWDGGLLRSTYTIVGTNDTPAPRWERITAGGSMTNDDTKYTVVVFSVSGGSATFVLDSKQTAPNVNDESSLLAAYSKASSTWSTIASKSMWTKMYDGSQFLNYFSFDGDPVYVTRYSGGVYGIYSRNPSSWGTYTTDDFPAIPLSQIFFNGKWYFGFANGTNVRSYTSAEVIADAGFEGQYLTYYNNYLWKADVDTLSYSNDASVWTNTVVTPPNDPIRAIAGMGGSMYFLTDFSLSILAPGDIPQTVLDLPYDSPRKMVSFQGDLYMILGGQVLRYDASGTVLPVSPLSLTDGYGLGEMAPKHIYATDSSLFLLCGSVTDTANASKQSVLFIYSPQGWNVLGLIADTCSDSEVTMYHDPSSNMLFITTDSTSWALYYDKRTINPYVDTSMSTSWYSPSYNPTSWIEFGEFYGAVTRLNKDPESVFIHGENLNGNVDVYYRTDGDTAWTLLGEADNDTGSEIRWSALATRPDWKSLRIGLLLKRDTSNATPRIKAVSLKYIPMVNDRFRWQLSIKVPAATTVMDVDDEVVAYTQAQMITHLDSCISSVKPVIYQDVDGTQYSVKVVSHTRSVDRFDFPAQGSTPTVGYIYHLGIEQVVSGTYTP